MRPTPPNQFRVTLAQAIRLKLPPHLASDDSYGRNGLFCVPFCGTVLRCIVADGEGWEHVSVSLPNRCPTWEEMCYVKDLFWAEDECVVQYHPPRSEYVNLHRNCLHLWRPTSGAFATPPRELVG